MSRVRNISCWLVPVVLAGFAAPAAGQVPTPIRAYELNGSLADTYGGPALTNNGATLTASGLQFAPNDGPSLSNWLTGTATSGHYALEYYFRFDDVTSYRKMVDFSDRTSDSGLYVRSSFTNLYPLPGDSGAADAFQPGTMAHVVVSRDGGTGAFSVVVDGVQQLNVFDTTSIGVFSAAGNIIHFFRDDATTSFGEASAGFVDFIRVYERPLTLQESQELYAQVANVPEPTLVAMAGIGMGGAALAYRRRWRRTRLARKAR